MHNSESDFRSLEPAPEVRRFVEQQPRPSWQEALRFFLDKASQVESDGLVYIIDGGVAVELLRPGERNTPKDIDVITRSSGLQNQFINSGLFDVKTVREWFEVRGLPYDERRGDRLFAASTPVSFADRTVYILNPEFLVASKVLSYAGRPMRPEDQRDVDILSVHSEALSDAIAMLTG